MTDTGTMRVLAIDTATDSVVTGVATITGEDVTVLAARSVADHRRHAELLTTLIGEVLEESGVGRTELAAVVVGCGPGPFTGLRVGLATAAAFADALGLPAYGVCSLDAIAAQVRGDRPSVGSVAVISDARRREVYWARYENGTRVAGPQVAAPAAVTGEVAGVDVAAGSPAHIEAVGLTVDEQVPSVPTVFGLATAAVPAIAAGEVPESLVPLYLRRPDAVERQRPATAVPR
ncbi:tRNA (adenosine(37)-N6)-threonylcarbamoyltransferase complex dimerization subunit type 1 TsaB [Gordonia pseudamarae]|uniref:tRNA (Adenosine(37)-N6)-threonylcarbamoyltransferase complex dimerization subunit type 1 TsaB n=1 Tax=Gordonia pseudamarae TaxID=2831662 RepID=A0ABX6IFL6_9ACTN|nr:MULTISPECIES: tRNA (adenosine(37)-N6)-threonylcarbamoyltransferase complex dimerization subunit type 1 TsaB [Gordonia]MBD0020434.1 tRNA (adenosine(37)-N6)-threonylcarbamoyltransferase complex dimerization subunit type 1 TsaB [Gordonia sp. (in: high G+C Gram-positive bacteria)]QHN25712.1 tRNA (adenosine(37)-N6)-threonylcarbamoyltransferase complex dimerization subunit type 1 TsaB [Gordonia pseudamarae]QHN34644.1 tRNA (adenosine(37)-N6)-threonylcarbamoyltransferase complex dimerization subunit 